jgi:hypothetical protein
MVANVAARLRQADGCWKVQPRMTSFRGGMAQSFATTGFATTVTLLYLARNAAPTEPPTAQ